MRLSYVALKDLRIALRKSYGENFDVDMTDEQINHIGVLVLTGLVESFKLEITNPELFTPSDVVGNSGSIMTQLNTEGKW